MTPPMVAFVAPSGTGKTTLLEKVIAELKRRGYRLGVLKRGPHGFDVDRPGKDTFRLTEAGADATAIVGPDRLAYIRRHEREPSPREVAESLFADVDLLLVEGYKRGDLPKIEVHRPSLGKPLLCRGERNDPRLLAVAADAPLDLDVPVLDLADPAGVADFLEEALRLARPSPSPSP